MKNHSYYISFFDKLQLFLRLFSDFASCIIFSIPFLDGKIDLLLSPIILANLDQKQETLNVKKIYVGIFLLNSLTLLK